MFHSDFTHKITAEMSYPKWLWNWFQWFYIAVISHGLSVPVIKHCSFSYFTVARSSRDNFVRMSLCRRFARLLRWCGAIICNYAMPNRDFTMCDVILNQWNVWKFNLWNLLHRFDYYISNRRCGDKFRNYSYNIQGFIFLLVIFFLSCLH